MPFLEVSIYSHLSTLQHITLCNSKMAEQTDSGTREEIKCGRPSVEVDILEIDNLITMGYSKTKIAHIMGISRRTLSTKISKQPDILSYGILNSPGFG